MLLEAAFLAAPVGLGVVDRTLRYLLVNDALAAIDGLPAGAHLGRTVREVHPELADELEPIYRSVFTSGQASVERELAAFGPGEARVLSASHYPIHGEDGEVIAVRTVVEDRTDHVRLRAAESELRRALRTRDVFLSAASHEVRTPLQSLQLVLDGLIRNGARPPITDQVARKLDLMRSQIQRLGLVIDNLVTVSRMASGGLALDPDQVDLAMVVRDVMARLQPVAARAGVSLELESDQELCGQWDPQRLEEIVCNLVSNAIKFGRGGAVEIAAKDRGDQVRLTVRDHGVGIAREDIERVFERFERVSEVSHGGLGMSLWIVRQLVHAHGGAIAVDSAPGEGSTFTVTLPREGPPSPGEPLESPLPVPPPAA